MRIVAKTLLLASFLAAGCSGTSATGERTPGDGAGGSGAQATGDGAEAPADAVGDEAGGTASDLQGSAGAGMGSPEPACGGDGPPSMGDDAPAGDVTDLPPAECGIPPTSQFPRLLNREYDAAIRDLLGVTTLTAAGGEPPSALLHDDYEGPLNEGAWNAYLATAEAVAIETMTGPSRGNFIDCDPALAECLRTTVETFGRKVFRRPLAEIEVDRYLHLAEEPTGTPDEIAETILFAFLSSPHFLTVPELDENVDPETGAFALTQHELATRLSLMLWGSVPDAELAAAADAGELGTPELVLAQARRMVEVRDSVKPQLVGAHRAFALMDGSLNWWKTEHDPDLYPAFPSTTVVNPVLAAEMDAFFEEVAFEGTFPDLFLSNVGFVSEVTAAIYGQDPTGFGPQLTRVEFERGERPGLLTRAGFLSSFSHYSDTGPILRGTYIAAFILGNRPGPPDPEAIATPVPDGVYATNRELVHALTSAAPNCIECHAILNPPGFVLEVYDPVGSVQSIDPRGGQIDGTADVTFAPGVVETIRSPEELMLKIAEAPEAQRLYAERVVSYATKRAPNDADACIVAALAAKLSQDDYPLRDVFVDLTQAASFRLRARGAD